MSRRTQNFRQVPWVGGVNTSVDPGVLNPQELVQADNVVFSSSGARIKREALEYLDPEIPTPDFRSSSGTTRTLKWTTNTLINIAPKNERLVVGEKITITGVTNYNVTDASVTTLTEVPQVVTIQTVADVSGSLNNTYFLLPAGDNGNTYYVWLNVNSLGVDPAPAEGDIGIEVAVATDETATNIASAIQALIHAEADFSASVLSDTITVTNVVGGLTADAADGDTGFTITTTTKGGHEITYIGTSSLTESSTAAGAIVVAKASSVISMTDYWRYDGSYNNVQLLTYATDDFQLFTLDESLRRKQVLGQPQVSTVICEAASTLTTGDYFLLSGGNNDPYYVWFNVDAGGGDPVISGRTSIEVAVESTDTDAQVATKLQTAIDAVAAFSATVNTATVTITNVDQGVADAIEDSNTGFNFSTTAWGASAPSTAVDKIRTLVFNERLIMTMTGRGNRPIKYNPDDNSKYQALTDDPTNNCPDGSFLFEHLGRVWMNDKDNPHRLHYSETFNETLWLGFGDSGAIDIFPGDGDPDGIVNAYVFKGILFVQKATKLYRVLGFSPEEFYVELVSNGIGGEGPFSVPVDQTDCIFLSQRGFHSQQATDAYGDTDATFLSAKIQPTFNSWNRSRIQYTQGAYIPELNSVAFSVAEQGQSSQNSVWLYNTEVQLNDGTRGAWYRWPDISCEALSRRFTNDKFKLIFGTKNGRIIQAQTENSYADFGTDGIEFRLKTGTLYPAQDPFGLKAFRKLTMVYRPTGNFSFLVKAYVDNAIAQSFSFNQISGLDLLGETFILGSSLLGTSAVLAPFTFSMEGYGRGIVLEITQPSANEQVEIWGYDIEFESEDTRQETV